jgi:dihydroorotate dehydrogenase (NAD+) catalytic subunit
VNTIRGLKLDPRTLRPALGPGHGGLSGPALKPVALDAVATCYRATGMPIVGMGGIRMGLDALEFIAAGARHVAIGTTLSADPDAPARIRIELHAAARERGWTTYEDAYAEAHREALSVRTT